MFCSMYATMYLCIRDFTFVCEQLSEVSKALLVENEFKLNSLQESLFFNLSSFHTYDITYLFKIKIGVKFTNRKKNEFHRASVPYGTGNYLVYNITNRKRGL